MKISPNSYKAKEAIHRARTRLLSRAPFYGYLCCRFKLREVPPDELPTMATDGIHLFYNPDFVVSLTKTQLEGGLAHETHHIYLKHPSRGIEIVTDDSEWPIAQLAMDYAINPHLKDGGFDLIEGAMYPDKEHWNDSFENHYKRLKKMAKKTKVPTCGGVCSGTRPYRNPDGSKPSPADIARMEADLQTAVMNAASFARAAGKLPADLERMIADLRAPIVSWKDVLRRFITAVAKNDYRWSPPNRRYIHQGLYLPSLRSEAVGSVLLILDGSGSTWDVFPQFISEFASIMLDVRPAQLHVMVWDTQCSWMQTFDGYADETAESLAALSLEMGAGGGSVFTDCFTYFEQQEETKPQVAIILTDMEIYFPEDPGYPVLWVSTTDTDGPFGDTVKIEV